MFAVEIGAGVFAEHVEVGGEQDVTAGLPQEVGGDGPNGQEDGDETEVGPPIIATRW